jgi:hypothetical protein
MAHVDAMSSETLGGGPDLVFVMGWGNRLDGENERWFLDRLADDYTVHAFEIPTNGTDFEADYLAPVREHARGLDDPLYLSHSTGGLVVGHLDPARAVHVSPWWAFYGAKLRGPVFEYGTKLPVERPFVPIDFSREEVGPRVSDEAWARLPKQVSPAFVDTIRDAQRRLPDPREDVLVCCTLRDKLVGLQGIGQHVPPERVRLYDGTHEPFSSADREAACSVVESALRELERL